MFYVYVIKSLKHSFIYVGSTNDLRRRFQEHNSSKEISTKAYAPFRLVYYEAYTDRLDALDRERKLKHHGSVIGHLKRTNFSKNPASREASQDAALYLHAGKDLAVSLLASLGASPLDLPGRLTRLSLYKDSPSFA